MATTNAIADSAPIRWRLSLPESLPDLKGRWLTLYTVVWAAILPLSLVVAAWGGSITLTTPTMWSPYGFATQGSLEGVYVRSVFSDAARATGLEVGDFVVAIDGWPVPTAFGRTAARTRVVKPDGAETTFTVRKRNGEMDNVTLVRSQAIEHERFREAGVSFPLARLLTFAGALLIPALFIPAAALLFLRRRREAVPACLSLSFLIIAGLYPGAGMIEDIAGFTMVFGIVAGTLLFTALYAFPTGRFEPRWTAIPFLLLFPAPFLLFFPSVGIVSAGMDFGFQVLALAVLIGRYRAVGTGPERQQLRWAFLGIVAGLLLLSIAILIDLAGGALAAQDPRWLAWEYAFSPAIQTLGFCAIATGLIISILRYRLYDADAVIGRSAAYGALTVGFVMLFAASQKLIELSGEAYFGRSVGALAGGVGAALAAVAIAPMHARAQRWAERRFQRALYRLRNALPPLVGDLRETSGVEQIAAATLDALLEGVRTCRAAIVANGTVIEAREIAAADVAEWWVRWTPTAHDGVDCDRKDALFPVRVPLEAEGHGRVGWLLLGARPDGSLFGKTEREVIEEIAEPVARAVQVALGRQEREAAHRKSFEAIERRFKSIEQQLARLKAGAALKQTSH